MSEVERVTSTYAARLKAIRNDGRLNDTGRRVAIAKAWTAAKRAAADATAKDRSATEKRRTELSRELFGYAAARDTSAVVALRDAQERASRCATPAEARALFSRAADAGDDQLVQAVVQHAWNKRSPLALGWNELLDDIGEANPATAEALTEYAQVTGGQSTAERVAAGMQLSHPAELRDLSSVEDVEKWLAGFDPTTPTAAQTPAANAPVGYGAGSVSVAQPGAVMATR